MRTVVKRRIFGVSGVSWVVGWLGWGRGCSEGSGRVFRRFRAVGHGPEGGRAGDTAVVVERVVDDAAGPVDA